MFTFGKLSDFNKRDRHGNDKLKSRIPSFDSRSIPIERRFVTIDGSPHGWNHLPKGVKEHNVRKREIIIVANYLPRAMTVPVLWFINFILDERAFPITGKGKGQ